MPSLSVVVLTFNEERHIGSCLASARSFADELLVLDSFSQDATRDLAAQSGARLLLHQFQNYALQRNAALDAALGDWVFFLDADERASEAVGEEVRARISDPQVGTESPVLYWVPRKNYIFGRWINHTGWSPDYQPRLLRKGKVRFDPGRPVHELALAQGREGFLKTPLVHLNYDNLAQFRAKQAVYTRLEAQMLFDQGAQFRWRSLLGQPVREFARRFFELEGYKDGGYGLLLSGLMAYYALSRQRILRQMSRGSA